MEEQPRQTAKQRVLEAQGKEVPLDLFLYSCLEQERLLRAKKGTGTPVLRWPVLGTGEETQPTEDMTSGTLASVVTRLCDWYKEECPELAAREALDHRRLGAVVKAVVALSQDMDRLYTAHKGEPLPDFGSPDSPNAPWEELVLAIDKYFSTYKTYIVRYLQWTFATEQVETFVPGSRPPIGKYAPPMLRKDGDRGRGGPGGGRGGPRGGGDRGGPRGGGDRGPRGGGDRPPSPRQFEDRPPRPSNFADRPPREDRPPHEDRPQRDDRPPREDRGPRGGGDRGPRRGPPDEQTSKMTEAALMEVNQALESLKSDPSRGEVTLKPANSFYRRIQHQQIVDAGFHSESVGEGSDRAVKIARKDD